LKSLSKQSTIISLCRILLLAGIVLFAGMGKSWGQTYADTSSNGVGGLATVGTPNAATNSTSLTDFTTLNSVVDITFPVSIPGFAYTQLKFTNGTIPANSIVFIKYTSALSNLLGSLTITAYTGSTKNNTSTGDGTPVATTYYTTTAADGSNYLAVTSTQSFNSVRVRLGGLLGSMNIYYAFYYPLGTGCITPITATSSAAGVNIGSVDSLAKAIDGNINTGSTFNVTLQLAGTMTQSFYYNNTAASGDAATVALSIPASGLANVALLGNITIQPYNGNTAVGTANTLSNFLTLNLLNLVGGNNPWNVSFPVSGAFNRVDITSATTLGLLTGVKIYEVTLTPPKPTFVSGTNNDTVYVCKGSSATLIADNPTTGNEIRWYSSALASNTTILSTGASYTPPFVINTDTVFFAATGKTGCTPSSERVPVRVLVKPLPATPSALDSVICRGTSIILKALNPVAGDTYNWYKTVTGGTSLTTGTTYTTTVLNADTTIYLQADSTNGCSSKRDTVVVTTLALPTITFTTPLYACIGTTLTSIPYSNAQNTPAFYHFAWGATATGVGFSASTTDVSIVNPIPIIIPNTANAATYTGDLVIKNATNGHQCPSTYPFSLIIIQKPIVTLITNYQ
jgi:hypothetical protein